MSKGSVKYVIHTLERERLAFKYVPDECDFNNGTVFLGGYSRCTYLMKKLAEEIFGVQRPRQPQFTQFNKCWISFRARYSEFCEATEKLEAVNMVLEPVRGFGNIVR